MVKTITEMERYIATAHADFVPLVSRSGAYEYLHRSAEFPVKAYAGAPSGGLSARERATSSTHGSIFRSIFRERGLPHCRFKP